LPENQLLPVFTGHADALARSPAGRVRGRPPVSSQVTAEITAPMSVSSTMHHHFLIVSRFLDWAGAEDRVSGPARFQ
jgi:hypothetical protein